ncbi:MAG: HlyD family secretion protein [Candidatus Margulisiibacteriota bacterium]
MDKINEKKFWERSRVKLFAAGVGTSIVLVFGCWWLFFSAYISTNDSRIATNIIKIAPIGVGGAIINVNVSEGAQVKSGDILMEIDHRIPNAQYIKAKAKFQQAKNELERIKNLYGTKVSSQKDYDNAQMNYDMAEADLRLAEISFQNTFLKSPIDGIIIQKNAQPGNLIEPGQVAMMIADVDHAWVNANIEETNISKVKIGQLVYVSIDEGGDITGRVEEINVATASQFSLLPAENAGGNFTKIVQKIPIKIALDPHPNHKILRAGQSVSVKIKVR